MAVPSELVYPLALRYGREQTVLATLSETKTNPINGSTFMSRSIVTFMLPTQGGAFLDPNSFFEFNVGVSNVNLNGAVYSQNTSTTCDYSSACVVAEQRLEINSYLVEQCFEANVVANIISDHIFSFHERQFLLYWLGYNDTVLTTELVYNARRGYNIYSAASAVAAAYNELQLCMIPLFSALGPWFNKRMIPIGFMNSFKIEWLLEDTSRAFISTAGANTQIVSDFYIKDIFYHMFNAYPRGSLSELISNSLLMKMGGQISFAPDFYIPVNMYTRLQSSLPSTSTSHYLQFTLNLRSVYRMIIVFRPSSYFTQGSSANNIQATLSMFRSASLNTIRAYVQNVPIPLHGYLNYTSQACTAGTIGTAIPQKFGAIVLAEDMISSGGLFKKTDVTPECPKVPKTQFNANSAANATVAWTTGVGTDACYIELPMEAPQLLLDSATKGITMSGNVLQFEITVTTGADNMFECYLFHGASWQLRGTDVIWTT